MHLKVAEFHRDQGQSTSIPFPCILPSKNNSTGVLSEGSITLITIYSRVSTVLASQGSLDDSEDRTKALREDVIKDSARHQGKSHESEINLLS